MARLTGAAIMARALKDQGVEYMFGIVGVPVEPIANEVQKVGIKFYGCRNEQTASYAAGAVGYLTGRPGDVAGQHRPGEIRSGRRGVDVLVQGLEEAPLPHPL